MTTPAPPEKRANTDKRVPVTVLTGFLGSGKTTLLNHILKDQSHGLRFAIIENEFGEVGVDEKLIGTGAQNQEGDGKTDGSYIPASEELVEVMNGCICCTVRGDLVDALKRLHKKVKDFDAVLIETTGMADPAPVAQTFFVDDDIQEKYRLDGIITVVDAKHVVQHLEEEKPEGVENESVEQIAFADRIILNKCDLLMKPAASDSANGGDASEESSTKIPGEAVCKEENVMMGNTVASAECSSPSSMKNMVEDEEALKKVESHIRAVNPQAQIIRSKFSKVNPKQLLNLSAFDLDRVLEMDPEFLKQDPSDHVHDSSVSSVAWSFPGLELNLNKLEAWIGCLMQELGTELLRYKGVLAIKGCKQKFIFQGVHMLFSGGFAAEILGGKASPDTSEWKSDEDRECRIVFIGKEMKQKHGDKLKKEFLDCKAEEPLRFKVGQEVEARVTGGFKPAVVLKQWDQGNPYRLEIQNEKKTNVWGPIDDERFVRARQ